MNRSAWIIVLYLLLSIPSFSQTKKKILIEEGGYLTSDDVEYVFVKRGDEVKISFNVMLVTRAYFVLPEGKSNRMSKFKIIVWVEKQQEGLSCNDTGTVFSIEDHPCIACDDNVYHIKRYKVKKWFMPVNRSLMYFTLKDMMSIDHPLFCETLSDIEKTRKE